MKEQQQDVAAAIERALVRESGLSTQVAREVAFHLTDWLDDLERYSAFVKDPGSFTSAQVEELVGGLLVHAPNHLAAAAALWGQPVQDIFDACGPALSEEEA